LTVARPLPRASTAARLLPAVLVGVLALAGCSSDAERDGAGAVTAAVDVSVDRLRVGDCLITPADGVVEDLAAVPCGQEHDGEVFHAFDLPDGEFPGAEPVQAAGEIGCLARFEEFVGTAFDDSELGLLPLTPVADGWAAGDQGVVCIVQDEQGGLTGTLRAAER